MSESKSSQSRFPQIIWKVCNLCMSLFFALATYVQVNDPDSAIWMVGYGLPAILCFLIGLKADVTETLPWRRLANLHVLISSAVVGLLGWTMYKKRITNIFQEEEGREFSGLLLTVVWLLLCRNSGRSDVGVGRLFPAVAVTMFPIVSWLYYYINKDLRSSWPSHCNTAI